MPALHKVKFHIKYFNYKPLLLRKLKKKKIISGILILLQSKIQWSSKWQKL